MAGLDTRTTSLLILASCFAASFVSHHISGLRVLRSRLQRNPFPTMYYEVPTLAALAVVVGASYSFKPQKVDKTKAQHL